MSQQFPERTAGAVILNPDGKILLVKTHKWKDNYAIPGGHIELGETAEKALKREIKEETGLDIFDIEFLDYQDCIYDNMFWKKKHFLFLDFVCRTNSSDVTIHEEFQEFVWVDPEEALKLPMNPYTKKAVESYIMKVTGND